MNNLISPCKTALTFGILFGGLHLAWSLLVALGWAQALVDFIFWAHMITLSVVINPFDLITAGTLVIVTFFVGSIFGYLMAIIWNRLHRA